MVQNARVFCLALLLGCIGTLSMVGQSLSLMELRQDKQCRLIAPEGYLDRFWSASVSLQNDATTVAIHLGDSHVQGGFFSMPIRNFFDESIGLAGLGWVAPYTYLRSNQPYPSKAPRQGDRWSGSFITNRKYGDSQSPTGITLTAEGKGNSNITITAEGYFPIHRAVVFRDASTPALYPKGGVPQPLHIYGGEKVVADTLNFSFPQQSLHLTAPRGARWYGVSLESQASGVLLHTIGYNGAFFSTYDRHSFTHHIGLLRPRLIILSLGTNEMVLPRFSVGDFTRNVRSLVSALQRELPECALVLTSPVQSNRKASMQQPVALEIARILEQTAKSMNCGFIDIFAAFGGVAGIDPVVRGGMFAKDMIHLTKEGYEAIGSVVAYALSQDFRRFIELQQPQLNRHRTQRRR